MPYNAFENRKPKQRAIWNSFSSYENYKAQAYKEKMTVKNFQF